MSGQGARHLFFGVPAAFDAVARGGNLLALVLGELLAGRDAAKGPGPLAAVALCQMRRRQGICRRQVELISSGVI
jgi:hypothetical protein